MASDPTVTVTSGYVPGSIGRIAELHGTYYADHWGFDLRNVINRLMLNR